MGITGNAERMAQMSICDGFRILWRELGHDIEQDMLVYLKELILNNCRVEESELNRFVKFKVLRDDHSPHGRLSSVQVTGAAAHVAAFLPWHWYGYISEYHVKVYADEVYQGATNGFVDQLYATDDIGAMKASFFGKDKRNSTSKAGGSKGARLGSKKSDVQVVAYKRQNQRTGIEGRVKDKVLFRIWADIDELRESAGGAVNDAACAGLYHGKAGKAAYTKLLAELRRRGINIADYFSTVSPYAQGAIADGMYLDLDLQEEHRKMG